MSLLHPSTALTMYSAYPPEQMPETQERTPPPEPEPVSYTFATPYVMLTDTVDESAKKAYQHSLGQLDNARYFSSTSMDFSKADVIHNIPRSTADWDNKVHSEIFKSFATEDAFSQDIVITSDNTVLLDKIKLKGICTQPLDNEFNVSEIRAMSFKDDIQSSELKNKVINHEPSTAAESFCANAGQKSKTCEYFVDTMGVNRRGQRNAGTTNERNYASYFGNGMGTNKYFPVSRTIIVALFKDNTLLGSTEIHLNKNTSFEWITVDFSHHKIKLEPNSKVTLHLQTSNDLLDTLTDYGISFGENEVDYSTLMHLKYVKPVSGGIPVVLQVINVL